MALTGQKKKKKVQKYGKLNIASIKGPYDQGSREKNSGKFVNRK